MKEQLMPQDSLPVLYEPPGLEPDILTVPATRTVKVADLARRILEPLCDQTARFLRGVAIGPHDKLHVTMHEDGSHFIVRAYARVPHERDAKIAKVVEAYKRGEITDQAIKLTLDALAGIKIPESKQFTDWVDEWEIAREKRVQAVTASWQAQTSWINNVPEHEPMAHGRWKLAATDVTALVMNATWPDDRLEWGDETARERYHYLLLRFMQQTVASQQRALYKLKGVIPELPQDWIDHADENHRLAGYQKVATIGSLGQEASANFSEQGTGKTLSAIQRICIESERKLVTEVAACAATGRKRNMYRVLITCPKNVRDNWVNEFHSFAVTPGKIAVLRGGALNRQKIMIETILPDEDSRYGVCVCSYEAVGRSWEQIRMVPWDLVIADESHYMKSVRRARGQQMLELRAISDARMAMTGTPVCNGLLDLYMQLEFLGEGLSGFSSWTKFKEFYAVFEKTGSGNRQREKLVSYQNLPFMKERLARLAFMVSKKEALPDLPDKTYDTRYFDMTQTQREWYKKMATQLAAEIDADKKMTATNILVKLLRLAQICGGYASWDARIDPETGDLLGESAIEHLPTNPLIDEFVEYVRETDDDEKVIAWACFIPFVDKLTERLTAEGIPHVVYTGRTSETDREEYVRRFNQTHARECKVFIGNPAAGGTGINVRGYDPDQVARGEDHGCDVTHVAYLLQNWSHAHRSQSEDRAHRRGTRRNVQYTVFLCRGTILEEINTRLTSKKMNAYTIQDVRDILRAVLDVMPEEDDE